MVLQSSALTYTVPSPALVVSGAASRGARNRQAARRSRTKPTHLPSAGEPPRVVWGV